MLVKIYTLVSRFSGFRVVVMLTYHISVDTLHEIDSGGRNSKKQHRETFLQFWLSTAQFPEQSAKQFCRPKQTSPSVITKLKSYI